jgi:hypothetical protein
MSVRMVLPRNLKAGDVFRSWRGAHAGDLQTVISVGTTFFDKTEVVVGGVNPSSLRLDSDVMVELFRATIYDYIRGPDELGLVPADDWLSEATKIWY